MTTLEYMMCDTLNVQHMKTTFYICDDMSITKQSDKTYSHCKDKQRITDHPCFGYLQLKYYDNPFLYVTTPPMKCLFGIQKNGFNQFNMSLQFTNLDTDSTMKQFHTFIEETEFECMRQVGLGEEEEERFISQIKQDKQGKYEPNLSVKLPFRYNRFETDIYADNSSTLNLLQLPSFTMVQCDIYLDKMWKMNEKFYSKWKARCIHVL
jgi:hypothetical protein